MRAEVGNSEVGILNSASLVVQSEFVFYPRAEVVCAGPLNPWLNRLFSSAICIGLGVLSSILTPVTSCSPTASATELTSMLAGFIVPWFFRRALIKPRGWYFAGPVVGLALHATFLLLLFFANGLDSYAFDLHFVLNHLITGIAAGAIFCFYGRWLRGQHA